MEFTQSKTNQSFADFSDSFEQFAESTNPFQNSGFSAHKQPAGEGAGKTGKRPRISKPVYSSKTF